MNGRELLKKIQGFVMAALALVGSVATADPVELQYAAGDYYPTGTGSYSYRAFYTIAIDYLAHQKVVGIWGRTAGTNTWGFYPGNFAESVPGNKEIWTVNSSVPIDQFVIKYELPGTTHWDNNAGDNYALQPYGETKMIGRPSVIHGGSYISGTGGTKNLIVSIGVKNLAYTKEVGIVYTTDGWLTANTAFGYYNTSHLPANHPGQPQAETWRIDVPIGVASSVEFAIFYKVNGNTYWANNFSRNYKVTATP
jgi:hypothetical protein